MNLQCTAVYISILLYHTHNYFAHQYHVINTRDACVSGPRVDGRVGAQVLQPRRCQPSQVCRADAETKTALVQGEGRPQRGSCIRLPCGMFFVSLFIVKYGESLYLPVLYLCGFFFNNSVRSQNRR